MIEQILPRAVAAEESFGDPDAIMLFPGEEAVVARAGAKRLSEFAAARGCARSAMRRLGVPAGPILPGERGAPQWPEGIVGSMTHCPGYRAAALAHARDIAAIGIDAEPHEPLPDRVAEMVTLAAEQAMLDRLSAQAPEVCWDRLLFSAKEAVYKAWFPLTGRWLDFQEADIAIDQEGGFVARLLVTGLRVGGRVRPEFEGRYLVSGGLLLTAVALVPQALWLRPA